jgi:sugar lactone lactonase YvrE
VLPVPSYVLRPDSFANDLAIDLPRGRVYLADPAGGANAALIVMDLETGLARRLLQGHYSVSAEPIDLVIGGQPVEVKGPGGTVVRPHLGVNPLALDPKGEWLYFGAMHGRELYRVRASILARAVEPDSPDVTRHVEHVGPRPITDGITVSESGTVYLGDLAASGLGALGRDGEYRLLAKDARRLAWLDAFSYGPDGRVYAVANRLHESAVLSAGKRQTRGPFMVLSFLPDSPGFSGR